MESEMIPAHVNHIESEITIVNIETSILNKVSTSVASIISPEVLKPYPKASARKKNVKSRQLKTRILTDTPVRNEIRLSKEKKILKQTKNQQKVSTKDKKETKNYLLRNKKQCKPKAASQLDFHK